MGKTKDTKPKRKRKTKKDGPKRGKSAYIFYSQEIRQELTKEQPELSITDASKEIGKRWGRLTDEQKAPYAEMAKKDKERYEREKAEAAAN
jgi:hypothetical protein